MTRGRDARSVGDLAKAAAGQMAQGRPAAAEAFYRQALALAPTDPIIIWNLGVLLAEAERHDDALATADQALRQAADHPEALMVRGNALTGLARYGEAVDAYRAAAAHPRTAYDALTRLGGALAAQGDYDMALEALDRAVALKPGEALALFRRAVVRLQLRDFARGFADYEARWRIPTFVAQSGGEVSPALAARLPADAAQADPAGRRVLLLGEQGVGDQMMFASVIPDLAAVAASVTCVCNARLVRLFQASFPGVTFTGPLDARIRAGDVDVILALGSLGRRFRPDEAAFPGRPYLRPRPEVRATWAARLGPKPAGLRIGLSWRGGTTRTRTGQRSLSLARLAPILELADCEFVNLQYGDTAAELAGHPAVRCFPAADTDDFEDLAGLVAEMDVVVSVQTALVHLSGGLGVACHTLVPHNPEWRYAAQGAAMPWYRSVRLHRQPAPGAWDPPILEVAAALNARLAAPDRR